MAADHDDRVSDTFWFAALFLLVDQYFWQFLEALSRGLILPWLASLALLTGAAGIGWIGAARPRPRIDHAILAFAAVLLLSTLAWHLLALTGPAMKEPGRREVARLLLNRYLVATVTIGPMLAAARLAAAAGGPMPPFAGKGVPPVIAAFGAAALLFLGAARHAGVGPVGPGAVIVLAAVAFATAGVVSRLAPRSDA